MAWRGCSLHSKLSAPPATTAGAAILDPDGDDITAAKLAVDRQIEHREVANSAFDLELRPDRPDVFWSRRWLCPCQLAFVPRHALVGRRGSVHFILHGHTPRLQKPRRMSCRLRRRNQVSFRITAGLACSIP